MKLISWKDKWMIYSVPRDCSDLIIMMEGIITYTVGLHPIA